MIDQHRELFKEEANELLVELESSLLELEESKDDSELISKIFRALHTIKGSGAMFGFDEISEFTHEVETIYDKIREGDLTVTKELIDLTLAARDQIKVMLDGPDNSDDEHKKNVKKLIVLFQSLLPKTQFEVDNNGQKTKDLENSENHLEINEITYRIRFRPLEEIFITGTNPLFLLDELKVFGECRIFAFVDKIPELENLNPESCYTYWEVFLTTTRKINDIKDVFIFVEDSCDLKINVIDHAVDDDIDYKRLGEILVEKGEISTEDLQKALKQLRKIGDVLVESGITNEANINAALLEQKHVRDLRKKRKETESKQSIRVSSDKLDRLVNLVGEMVTVQALLSQVAVEQEDSRLSSIAEEVEHLTEELRENTMSIRMVPIGSMFNKFKRLVRDLSNDLQKEINLETEGAETELDKTVIEKLNDPLVHLIRNSIDHGIEKPDIRDKANKSRVGKVSLSAEHSGANVLLKIRDDGAGIDPQVIRNKAIEKGLISPDEELSNKEVFSQIFAPGFSTAKEISNVSGRGVGMDVVKRTIDSLRGTVEIDSQKGVGTVILLRIPLTLAIIEGLLVEINNESFIIPLSIIEECIELRKSDVEKVHGRNIVNVRGEIIPFIRLRDQFAINSNFPTLQHVVITNIEGFKVGFVVDEVIGEHQTVIKSLGSVYRNVDGISGATILGDGSVALILDAPKLSKLVEIREKESYSYAEMGV
jgi:two-component system, chemotaxis family, sensor kinase CheA